MPSKQQIITIALHHYVGSEREKSYIDFDDASSCHSGRSGLSTRSDRTKFLPHSRLKGIEKVQQSSDIHSQQISKEALDIRRNSIRRNLSFLSIDHGGDNYVQNRQDETLIDQNIANRNLGREFKKFAMSRPTELAKHFALVENANFCHSLLALDNSLVHFICISVGPFNFKPQDITQRPCGYYQVRWR